MPPIVRVGDLSKKYKFRGGHQGYQLLREAISNSVAGLFRPRPVSQTLEHSEFWALKDVNFSIEPGEKVGIIGRNGAGKSTLLKILSRITEPTSGSIRIRGRIASLLEVGTGFHPELTGRENIFLNGAIIGMSRSEIRRKFDEIVSFAGIEKFLDTPVKHYSSGMYVRLAFAAAAHLEQEILILDEVLAVGDSEFQRKCMRKMREVAAGGRTILIVSHNMSAIQHLCERGILLEKGEIVKDGSAAEVVEAYLNGGMELEGIRLWQEDSAPHFRDRSVSLRSIKLLDQSDQSKAVFDVKEPVHVEVEYIVHQAKWSLNTHLYFSGNLDQYLFVSMDNLDNPWRDKIQPEGLYRARCTIPANFFNEGTVRIVYLICTQPTSEFNVSETDVLSFQVVDDMKHEGVRGNWNRNWPTAAMRPRLCWSVERI